ncbi:MAG TPA: hypothetical protein HA367_03835 [Candidatus Methanofastidiosum sp.]|jgi:hypothetical protein|nr:hypothetical protein [Methanofastidiosum sp.]
METLTTQKVIEITLKAKEMFTILTGNPNYDELRSRCFQTMNEGIEELKKRGIRIE